MSHIFIKFFVKSCAYLFLFFIYNCSLAYPQEFDSYGKIELFTSNNKLAANFLTDDGWNLFLGYLENMSENTSSCLRQAGKNNTTVLIRANFDKDFANEEDSKIVESSVQCENKNNKLTHNTYDCAEFKVHPLARDRNFFDKSKFDDRYIIPSGFDIAEVILNDNFSVPFAHNIDEKVNFERNNNSTIYFEKYNDSIFGDVITIYYLYKNYRSITIKDKFGNMCTITYKNVY